MRAARLGPRTNKGCCTCYSVNISLAAHRMLTEIARRMDFVVFSGKLSTSVLMLLPVSTVKRLPSFMALKRFPSVEKLDIT